MEVQSKVDDKFEEIHIHLLNYAVSVSSRVLASCHIAFLFYGWLKCNQRHSTNFRKFSSTFRPIMPSRFTTPIHFKLKSRALRLHACIINRRHLLHVTRDRKRVIATHFHVFAELIWPSGANNEGRGKKWFLPSPCWQRRAWLRF